MAYPKINLDEIIAEFGLQYREGGLGEQNLRVAIMQQPETLSRFEYYPTDDTVAYKATASISRVLQAYQVGFTPIGTTKFELEKIPLNRIKIDEAIVPDEIMPSYLGFLAKLGEVDRTKWGIVRYMIENLIIAKSKEDMEVSEIFKGETGVITPGTAQDAGKTIDGVRKKIRDGHTAGSTNMITMGAVPTDPVLFVEYVEDMVNQIPEIHRFLLDGFDMSQTLRTRFKVGMQKKYNMQYAQKSDLLVVNNAENIRINGLASMAGSEMIYGTMANNKAAPEKWGANKTVFDMQKENRAVKLLTDWWFGIGFWYLPYVYHNDRDLV
jgi:hypothetical protein